MKPAIILLILCFFGVGVCGQDKITNELKTLSDNKEYDKIITQYSSKSNELTAKSLFYVGLAYFMKEDDQNCIKFMNLSLERDAKDPAPYYYKGSTLNYMQKFDEAVKCFNDALQLKAGDAVTYSGLGDSYYNLNKAELALEAYKNATTQPDCPPRPYSMIAQIYSDLKDNDKALEAYYAARSKIPKESSSYLDALFNIGLLESLKGNYDGAEPAFLELIGLDRTDYHSYAKLIQIYYHRKEYHKAKPYQEKLYEAKKKGELKDNLEDMYCFDQFKWNDKLIQAFERYEEGNKKNIYYKHLFYVVGQKDIEMRIQTEYSPLSIEMGGTRYLLGMTKGNEHATFNIGFNEDLLYDDLKKAVIDILEGKAKPVSTSRKSN